MSFGGCADAALIENMLDSLRKPTIPIDLYFHGYSLSWLCYVSNQNKMLIIYNTFNCPEYNIFKTHNVWMSL